MSVPTASPPSVAGEHSVAERYAVEVIRDVRIPTADPGVSLSADLFRPVDAGVVPALVTVLPYRKDAGSGVMHEPDLRWFAARGYASMLVDFRGTGSSDGRQRPPFDAAEADDAVAAIEWAARQPWCTGNVGMWGHSYGAIMSMRTATRRPAPLRAIAPVMGMLSPERDFVHPAGVRGCAASLVRWGAETLLNQLLPPLDGHGSAAAQRRWRDRLATRPWAVDLFDHGPGDPVWLSRAIDGAAITVPALCVAGWRDLFCDAAIRAYEAIDAPKRLLVGPWMHTTPHVSPFDPVDFRVLALRWWQHWLAGVDTGLMDEPPVTLYLQGHDGNAARWQQFDSWPPAAGTRRWVTAEDTTLTPYPDDDPPTAGSPGGGIIAEQVTDPTVGTLGGLWGMPTTGYGLPLDQHDDDRRTVTATSDQLGEDLRMVGRPVVTAHLAAGSRLRRLVVRLVDVDLRERTTLITAGVAAAPGTGEPCRVTLAPTCYRLPPGHRLRIVLGDADFPRLWPEPADADGGLLRLTGVEVSVPVLPATRGTAVHLPVPDPMSGAAGRHLRPHWEVTRDLIHDAVRVDFGHTMSAPSPTGDHLMDIRNGVSATVSRDAAAAARVEGRSTATVRMGTGETITVDVRLSMTGVAAGATGHVDIDGRTVFSHHWAFRAPDAAPGQSASTR